MRAEHKRPLWQRARTGIGCWYCIEFFLLGFWQVSILHDHNIYHQTRKPSGCWCCLGGRVSADRDHCWWAPPGVWCCVIEPSTETRTAISEAALNRVYRCSNTVTFQHSDLDTRLLKKNLCRCSVEDDRLSGWSSTFHRFLYRGTVRDNNTGPKEKHKIILPLRNFCWKENKTMSVMFKAGAWWGVLGSNKFLIVSCPEKDAFYTGAMVWNSFVVRRWQSLPQLLHVPYREVVDQAGVTKFRFCFDTKTKKMRPCRSEAKQLRCICSSCACETAKAFSQDSSDPLGPRDGLRPGGNRHEVLAGRRSLSRRNLAFGRGKQKKRSAIDRALDSKFLGWAYGQPQGVVVLRWPTLQEKGGEGVGWGQASTEACHTHRGGPTLLPGFRKRASVGTDAGAVAPVAPVRLAKQK